MNRRSRVILLVGLGALGISIGALREFTFVNLNYWISYVSGAVELCYAHSFFNFLSGSSLGKLTALKWTMTLAFIALMLAFNLAFLQIWFGKTSVRKWVLFTYASALIVSAVFYVAHLFSPGTHAFIILAVKALHALQYPFLPLVLIPAISVFKAQEQA